MRRDTHRAVRATPRRYFRQELRDGRQIEHDAAWQSERSLRRVAPVVTVDIEDRGVRIQAWQYDAVGASGLPDDDMPENASDDGGITDHLYGGEREVPAHAGDRARRGRDPDAPGTGLRRAQDVPPGKLPGTTRKLFALSLSIALAMSGVGIILPIRFGEVHLASVARALMGLSLARLALARSTAIVFALVASYGIRMALLTPAMSALVSRRGGAHAGAALGLESSAKSVGQVAGPVLGGVLFGASVAVPFWLASGLLLGLAPIFAWSGRRTHEPPRGRAARGKRALGRQEAR